MTRPKKSRVYSSEAEQDWNRTILELFESCPIPKEEMIRSLGLFLRRQDLSRILFLTDLYRQILPIHGSIMEFGVRWGQSLALYSALRGIFEPFNYSRRIVGFDTFKGFPAIHAKDGASSYMESGALNVTENYKKFLEQILDFQESQSPVAHMKKYEVIEGDALEKFEEYLKLHPETVVALAYFDFDIYEPTYQCLTLLKDRIVKGSVIAFDELNHPDFPGETRAVQEALGLNKINLKRSPYSGCASFFTVE